MNIVFKFCCDYSKRMSKNIFNNFEYITRHVLARKYDDCILNFWRADKFFTNGHFICSQLARNKDLHGLPSFLFMFANVFKFIIESQYFSLLFPFFKLSQVPPLLPFKFTYTTQAHTYIHVFLIYEHMCVNKIYICIYTHIHIHTYIKYIHMCIHIVCVNIPTQSI